MDPPPEVPSSESVTSTPVTTTTNNNNNDKSEEDRENEEKMHVDVSPNKEETSESKLSETPSTEDAKETPPSSSSNNNGNGSNTTASGVNLTLKDLEVNDNTQCRFNVNSYKMLFVIEGESYVYRRNSIAKARMVSLLS